MEKTKEALLVDFLDTPEIHLRRDGGVLVCLLRYKDENGGCEIRVRGPEQVMVDFMLDLKNAYEKLNGGEM